MSTKVPRILRIAYLHAGEVNQDHGYMAPAVNYFKELQARGEFQLDILYRPPVKDGVFKPGPDMEDLRKGRYDGLVSGAIDVDEYFHKLYRLGIPVVALDHVPLNPHIDAVSYDNVQGGELAARLLVELGHREFLFVSHFKVDRGAPKGADPLIEDPVSVERKSGMQSELFRHDGINVWPTLANISASHNHQHLRRDLKTDLFRMMESVGNPPDAIMTHGSGIADRVAEALEKLGLSIPKDVSLITFGTESPERGKAKFIFSQMEFACREMGVFGWELLRDRLTGVTPASAGRRQKAVPPVYKDFDSVRDRRKSKIENRK